MGRIAKQIFVAWANYHASISELRVGHSLPVYFDIHEVNVVSDHMLRCVPKMDANLDIKAPFSEFLRAKEKAIDRQAIG